ncbi:hypothetical protein V8C44DRAFT_292328 [Trichoderma aethiopicum]
MWRERVQCKRQCTMARSSLLTIAIPETLRYKSQRSRGAKLPALRCCFHRRSYDPVLVPPGGSRASNSPLFTTVTLDEDLISVTCRLWECGATAEEEVGCCRPNARFRRGLKRRSSCLMHACHGVCKSPFHMHTCITCMSLTTSILHISHGTSAGQTNKPQTCRRRCSPPPTPPGMIASRLTDRCHCPRSRHPIPSWHVQRLCAVPHMDVPIKHTRNAGSGIMPRLSLLSTRCTARKA